MKCGSLLLVHDVPAFCDQPDGHESVHHALLVAGEFWWRPRSGSVD